jgi:hypothetical protein
MRGTATKHGTLFISFSCEQRRLARMLTRRAGAEDSIRDTLTISTTAVSGAYSVVPSVEALRQFASTADEEGAQQLSVTRPERSIVSFLDREHCTSGGNFL